MSNVLRSAFVGSSVLCMEISLHATGRLLHYCTNCGSGWAARVFPFYFSAMRGIVPRTGSKNDQTNSGVVYALQDESTSERLKSAKLTMNIRFRINVLAIGAIHRTCLREGRSS